MLSTPATEPGTNCWRTSHATRGGFLIESRRYFQVIREAVLKAEKEVIVLAWDISDSLEMVRGGDAEDGYPSALADFLIAVLDEKPDLVIRILLWDYSLIYLTERDWLPFSRWRNPGHPRLKLVTDNRIPAGASHHQKLVVIDGVLAFCGGMDLAEWRWDSKEHLAEDSRRRSPDGEPYQPYHDVHMAMTGPGAADLRELAALRWKRASGEELPKLGVNGDPHPWPAGLPVHFENEDLDIALTFSRFEDYEPSHHIESLYLDIIASAERLIYIENQYLSSLTIVEALCHRLREPDGPEVTLVLTRKAGWAEEETLGVMRDRLLERLCEADEHGRFSSWFPFAEDEDAKSQIYVHTKLMMADDRMLIVGSANLSNRSMRVDSELAIGFLRDDPSEFVRSLRESLLAMHLATEPEEVREAVGRLPLLKDVISKLAKPGCNRLRVLEGGCENDLQRKLADSEILDPTEPISPIHHAWGAIKGQAAIYDHSSKSSTGIRILKTTGWITGFILLGAAVSRLWSSSINQERVDGLLLPLQGSPFALPILTGIIVVGGVIAVPINLLIIGASLTIGPWEAFACGWLGAMLAAAVSFGIGHHLGKPLVRRFAGEKLEALSASLENCGIGSMAVIRIMPIAPFGLLNLVAGISGLSFRVFMIGSAIGLLPGLAAVILVSSRFVEALENPDWKNWIIFGVLALAAGAGVWWIRKRFG